MVTSVPVGRVVVWQVNDWTDVVDTAAVRLMGDTQTKYNYWIHHKHSDIMARSGQALHSSHPQTANFALYVITQACNRLSSKLNNYEYTVLVYTCIYSLNNYINLQYYVF